MAEERGFLGRWSARKRAAREAESEVEAQLEAQLEAQFEAEPEAAAPVALEAEPEPVIDPADLPPLESIKSGVDVQAFLQRGVPKALRHAALRRLWAADPKIREFREVADYDWDFNAPGYGALLPGDDPKAAAEKLFQAMRERVAKVESVPQQSPPPSSPTMTHTVQDDTVAGDAPTSPLPQPAVAAAVSPGADRATAEGGDASSVPRRRRHGTAMPQ